jgi:D-xylose transport system ATP-binding protein
MPVGAEVTFEGQPRLALKGVGKRYGSVEALNSVDFEVYPGEIVALVGDNGAGKTTLLKTIAGAHQPDEGDIFYQGAPVQIHSPQAASKLGIAVVYQDLALCDNLDIVGNLYLGREQKRSLTRLLFENEMELRTRQILDQLSVTVPSLRRPVATLSGGQRQSVAVSRAVLWGSNVVLLDEPTAALGVEQTAMVARLIRQLRDRDISVVLISHNLAEVFSIADRIVVLRLGRRVGTFTPSQDPPERVVAAITGGDALQGQTFA